MKKNTKSYISKKKIDELDELIAKKSSVESSVVETKKQLTIMSEDKKDLAINHISTDNFFIVDYADDYLQTFFLKYKNTNYDYQPDFDIETVKSSMHEIKKDVIKYMRRFDIFLTPQKGVKFFLKGLKIFAKRCNNRFFFVEEGESSAIFESFLPITLNAIDKMNEQVNKTRMISDELGLLNRINSPAFGMWTNILDTAITEIIKEIIESFEKSNENPPKTNEQHPGQ